MKKPRKAPKRVVQKRATVGEVIDVEAELVADEEQPARTPPPPIAVNVRRQEIVDSDNSLCAGTPAAFGLTEAQAKEVEGAARLGVTLARLVRLLF